MEHNWRFVTMSSLIKPRKMSIYDFVHCFLLQVSHIAVVTLVFLLLDDNLVSSVSDIISCLVKTLSGFDFLKMHHASLMVRFNHQEELQ